MSKKVTDSVGETAPDENDFSKNPELNIRWFRWHVNAKGADGIKAAKIPLIYILTLHAAMVVAVATMALVMNGNWQTVMSFVSRWWL